MIKNPCYEKSKKQKMTISLLYLPLKRFINSFSIRNEKEVADEEAQAR